MMSDPEDRRSDCSFKYRAFGLSLISNMRLPGLIEVPACGLPEIQLSLGRHPGCFDQTQFREIWYQSEYCVVPGVPFLAIYRSNLSENSDADEIGYWLRYQDGTSVFIDRQANRIWVTWPESSC